MIRLFVCLMLISTGAWSFADQAGSVDQSSLSPLEQSWGRDSSYAHDGKGQVERSKVDEFIDGVMIEDGKPVKAIVQDATANK